MMPARRLSRALFRALLWIYPRQFRDRFGRDLEADFVQLARTRGLASVCRRAASDLAHAIALTHATERRERNRHVRIGGGFAGADTMVTDLRLAIRSFWKSPAFSAAATLTLALGIGVNLAVYSVFHAALVESLPVREPDRVVHVFTASSAGEHFDFSYPLYVELRDGAHSLEGLAAYLTGIVGFDAGERSERLLGEFVTSNYFPVLGLQLPLGPGLSGDDELRGGPKTVVISFALWQGMFGSDPGVIGSGVSVNGQTFTVVGVAPQDFSGIVRGQRADVWLSVSQFFPLRNRPDLLDTRESSWLNLVGRLAAGVTAPQAEQQLTTLLQRVSQAQSMAGDDVARTRPASAGNLDLVEGLGAPLRLLMATVGLMLLIACANVANLLLARSSSRQQDIAIRQALGASRLRLGQHVMVETLVLTAAGAVVGLLFAVWTVNLFELRATGAASALELGDGLRPVVVVFAVALSLLTTLITGLVPALAASRPDLIAVIKQGTASIGAAPPRRRMRSALAAIQIALSLLLVIGAGLFLRSLAQLRAVDPSLLTDRVVAATVNLTLRGYDLERGLQFYEQLAAQVASIPGVEAATLVSVLPVTGGGTRINLNAGTTTPPIDTPFEADIISASPGYFQTLGVPLLRGRDFTERDRAASPLVAIVNERLTQRLWGTADPIGQTLAIGTAPQDRYEVIGVARDTKYRNLRESARMTMYLPLAQSYAPAVNFAVRTTGSLDGTAAALRRAIAAVDPSLPLYNVRTLAEHVDRSLYVDTIRARLVACMALLALLVAAIGVYGLISFVVAERTREVALRLALGATRGEVMRLVLGTASRLACVGIAIGLVLSLWLARSAAARVYVEKDLYGVETTDLLPLAGGATLLYVVVVVASFVPALRVSRLDPVAALRDS